MCCSVPPLGTCVRAITFEDDPLPYTHVGTIGIKRFPSGADPQRQEDKSAAFDSRSMEVKDKHSD